jgi:murein DD-endopeptidase MepM/ murein hydrolase activator NlpD
VRGRVMRILRGLVGLGCALLTLFPLQAVGQSFWLPVVGSIVSGYGWRADPFGEGWKIHWGLDIAAPEGAPVAARAEGNVVFAGWAGSYGLVVVLEHGRDWHTLYAHLRTVHVRVGDRVRAGAAIGEVGSTGRSTGPHLHFEVRYRGFPVDPIPYLRH